jgi:hypothetical protein
MPSQFSEKDERKYEHIKQGYRERGVSNDEAEERAARTVNKERHAEGRTKEQREARHRGEEPTKQELYDRARDLGIEGRSRMDKDELKRAVQRES